VTYSVWNQAKRAFDYFETPEVVSLANAPKPGHLKMTKLGMTPSQASWPLPTFARPAGSGPIARGRIAHRYGGSLAGFDLEPSTVKMGLLLVAAFLLWRKFR
jgi:hypothetical protein